MKACPLDAGGRHSSMRAGLVRIGLVGLVGCSFAPQTAGADAAGSDDAPPGEDAPVATCHVAVSGSGTDAGKVGHSTGGTVQSPVPCPGSEPMVGVALLVSDNVAGGPQERSAQGIDISCAPVTVAATGSTGSATTIEAIGNGGASFSPSQSTGVTTCPPGWVISGMAVHSGQFQSAFIDMSLVCVQLDNRAQMIGRQVVYVAGSLTEPLDPNGVECGAGEVVVTVAPALGAGLDSLELACAAPICE